MKKVLGALALSLSMAASAENWVMVTDADNGTRMLVESDSWVIQKDKTDVNSPYYIAAMFRFISDSKYGDPFLYITKADSCGKGRGELVMREYENEKWVTIDKKWFEVTGPKMYDQAGKALCEIFQVRAREYQENKKPAASSSNGVKPNV